MLYLVFLCMLTYFIVLILICFKCESQNISKLNNQNIRYNIALLNLQNVNQIVFILKFLCFIAIFQFHVYFVYLLKYTLQIL